MANISKDYVSFAKKNIYSYIKMIMGKYFDKAVFDMLLDTYINVRYYDMYERKYRDMVSNINYYLRNKINKVVIDQDIAKKMCSLFKYIYFLDDVKKCADYKLLMLEINDYRKNIFRIDDSKFVLEFNNLIRNNEKRKCKFLKELDSDKFKIKLNTTNKKSVYYCELEYNINFPKIYSEYAIDRVYHRGIINEDMLFITYYLVSSLILKNAINGVYDIDYIVGFSISLFDKEDKFSRLINIIDNEIVKNNFVISINYSDYLEHRYVVDSFVSNGFKIAIVIDNKFDYKERSVIWVNIFSYIITDNEVNNFPMGKVIVRK